jgi:hypothetical protein
MLSVNGIWKSEVIQLNKAYLKKKQVNLASNSPQEK